MVKVDSAFGYVLLTFKALRELKELNEDGPG